MVALVDIHINTLMSNRWYGLDRCATQKLLRNGDNFSFFFSVSDSQPYTDTSGLMRMKGTRSIFNQIVETAEIFEIENSCYLQAHPTPSLYDIESV